MQADVAARIGVHWGSVQNWERGVTEPAIRHIPAITEFLGYNPEAEPTNPADWLVWARRCLGMTQEELATTFAIDPVTIWRSERGDIVLPPERMAAIHQLQKPA